MTYNQKAIAIVLNINGVDNISLVKRELVDFIKQVETDDRLYLYNETGLCSEKKSEIIAILAAYNFNTPFQNLIKDAIASLNFEDFSCGQLDKHIYILNDSLSFDSYHINKMLGRCKIEKCKVHILETTNYFEDSCKLTTFEELSVILSKLYKEST